MRLALLGLLVLGSVQSYTSSFARTPAPDGRNATVVMKNGQHSCDEYKQAIRQHGKIVVKYSFAARAFFDNSHSCHFTERPVGRVVNATDGTCMLKFACELKPIRGGR